VAIVRGVLAGESPFRNLANPAMFAAVGFYAWGYLSSLWSPDPEIGMSLTVGGLPYWILFLLLAPMLVPRAEILGPMCTSILVVGAATTAVILVDPNFGFYAGRFGVQISLSERTNPLALGTLGGTMMVIAGLTLFAEKTWFGKAWRSAAFTMGAGLCLLSGSRGQMIFAILVVLCFFPIAYRMRNAKGIALAGLAGVLVAGGLYFAASKFISSDNEDRWTAESLTTGGAGRLDNAIELLAAWGSVMGAGTRRLGLPVAEQPVRRQVLARPDRRRARRGRIDRVHAADDRARPHVGQRQASAPNARRRLRDADRRDPRRIAGGVPVPAREQARVPARIADPLHARDHARPRPQGTRCPDRRGGALRGARGGP
jgi:hypothetical protein